MTGNLTVTAANGGITQSGGSLIIPGTTTFSASGSNNNITLVNDSNNFLGQVNIANANNVSLADINDIILGSSTLSGTLNVTAFNGSITQAGALTVPGVATISASGNNNRITLDNNNNNFSSAVVISNGGNVTLADANDFILGTSSMSGSLNVTTVNGSITQNGAIIVPSTTTLSASGTNNNITLDNTGNDFTGIVKVSNGGNVSLYDKNLIDLGPIAMTGNLTITAADGSIAQSGGALTVSGTTTLLTSGSNNGITLANTGNDFSGAVTILNAGNVSLADANHIILGTSTITGFLKITTTNGSITQTGALTIPGIATFSASGTNNDITLDNATNNFSNAVEITNAGNVSLTDRDAIDLGELTVSNNLKITAKLGTITQNLGRATTVTGTTYLSTDGKDYNISMDASKNSFGRDIFLNSLGSITLKGTGNIIIGKSSALTLANNSLLRSDYGDTLTAKGLTVSAYPLMNTSSNITIKPNLDLGGDGVTLTADTIDVQGSLKTSGIGNVRLVNSKTLTLSNDVSATGSGSFTQVGEGPVIVFGNISTNNKPISFQDGVSSSANFGNDYSTVTAGNNVTFNSKGGNISFRKLTSFDSRSGLWTPPVSLLASATGGIDGGRIDGEIDLYNVLLSGKEGTLTGNIWQRGLFSPNGREAAESIYTNVVPHHGFTFNGYPVPGKLIERSTLTVVDTRPMTIPPRIPKDQTVIDSAKNPVLYRAIEGLFQESKDGQQFKTMAERNVELILSQASVNDDSFNGNTSKDLAIIMSENDPVPFGFGDDESQNSSRIRWINSLKHNDSIDSIDSEDSIVTALRDHYKLLLIGKEFNAYNKEDWPVVGKVKGTLKEKGSILFFYYGHGVSHKGQGFLLTDKWKGIQNASPITELVHGMVSWTKIKSLLSRKANKNGFKDILIASDSCSPSDLLESDSNDFTFKDVLLSPMQRDIEARIAFSATQYFSPSMEGQFTDAFKNELSKISGHLTQSGQDDRNVYRVFMRISDELNNRILSFRNSTFDSQKPDFKLLDSRYRLDKRPDPNLGFFLFNHLIQSKKFGKP